ncbi:hypothetical protein GCM10010472_05480 [Pseudonocardia halophobica]|uniref:Uncharacterized protein n=1 Tax=Pseudonocardia halophobica TaxID=29401 RepID=A0A9W6L3B3_9PSEU|nr:hypothetical protein [Pseudonocardia halophobica]GLL10314.1 hypothetical protein GCM10017577_14540 [Pseudonocardia halophobica]
MSGEQEHGTPGGTGGSESVRPFVPRQAPSPSDLARVRRLTPRPRVSPEAGDRESMEPRGRVRDRDRARILLRYARLMSTGRPIFCKPSRAELAGTAPRRQGVGADGKVIYPDRESAEAAARELEELGARAQRAYVCKRSRHGHYHLTTDLVRERRRGAVDAVEVPEQATASPLDVRAAAALAAIPQQRDRRSA